MKEPGQIAWETHETRWAENLRRGWAELNQHQQGVWAAVERAVRDHWLDEAAKVARGADPNNRFGNYTFERGYIKGRDEAAAAILALKAHAPK